MKKVAILVFILLVSGNMHFVVAQEWENFSILLKPGVEIPIGHNSALFSDTALYKLGGSVALKGQYTFPNLPWLYTEGIINYSLQTTQAQILSLLSAGLGAGGNLRIADIMSLQAGAEAGWYAGFYPESDAGSNPYLGLSAAVAWDFTPRFTLSAGAGYKYYLGYDSEKERFTDLYQGINLNIGTVFHLSAGRDRSKLIVENIEFDPVFPVFYGYYDNNSVGSITLRNGENSSITDLDIYYFVSQYMEQPKLSSSIAKLTRGETASLDLKALFTNSVLYLTENTRVSSEIIAEYTYLGGRFTQKIPYTLKILDRNSMTWDDDRKAACFVTAKDPTVLIFSKNTAGIIREQGYNPIDLKLRIAMGIFETLRLYGMNYVVDPQSSYIEASEDTTFIDYLQFPSQTLIYRAGDCDDLSILFSSMLESVGIETAFITIPGHIFMAFALDLSQEDAKKEFLKTEDLIFMHDKTWIPIEITLVPDGFMKAWKDGAKEWREGLDQDKASFYPIHQAWELFEPVGIANNTLSLVYPSKASILESYNETLNYFTEREISETVALYSDRIKSGGDSAKLRNRFGILYARYGKFDEAEIQFRRAIELKRNYASPLVNLGNIHFLRENFEEALRWYNQAKRISPDNRAALAGLAQVHFELEQYREVEENYTRLAEVDPQTAEQYAYLTNPSDTLGRASRAGDQIDALWDDEEE